MMGKDDQAAAKQAISDLFRSRNRPLNGNDVVQELQLSKSVVMKSLDQLVAESLLSEKLYGKQKIYWPNPSESVPAKEILLELDAKIRVELAKIAEIQKELKDLKGEFSSLKSEMSAEELRSKISDFRTLKEEQEEKLKRIKSNDKPVVSKEEKTKVVENREKMEKEWRKRKRLATEMANAIAESSSKRLREIFEEIGVSTDEEKNVKLP